MSGIVLDRESALLSMSLDGRDQLLVPIRLHAEEAISALYEVRITAVSAESDISPATVLHKPACVMLRHAGQVTRRFCGMVRSLVQVGQASRDQWHYELVIVPRLWRLSQTRDCRIYQQKRTSEILNALLQDAALPPADYAISGAPDPVLPYRAQFNETDLDFASRLLEEVGWFYYFRHDGAEEKLVVAASNRALTSLGTAPWEGDAETPGRIAALRGKHALTRGAYATSDYDPEAPGKMLKQQEATTLGHAGQAMRDDFTWPALTDSADTARDRAKRRMQAAEAEASLLLGEGDWPALLPGAKFELAPQDETLPAGTYGIRQVRHEAIDEGWLSGGAVPHYANSFEAFPEAVPWRQPLATARPVMAGLHAGVVLGTSADAEIHTDDLARVKVRLFWDHRGETSGEQAIWARVVQPWAGPGWGAQFLPRVGTEVAVAFLDGDPDRPVVVGGFYNGSDKPIFSAAERTKSGFRSRSSDGGGTADFNEFSFDDRTGNELVFLHAQKDLTVEVENDQSLTVNNCRVVSVKQDETVSIGGRQSIKVKGDRSVTVEQGSLAEHVSLGDYSLKVDAGQVTVEALQGITLKVGANSVTIDQTGIAINGVMVKASGQAMLDLKAPMSRLSGDGMLTLKGGLTTIN
ncbi:type VI secretion system Vgr family protein [Paracraurococcus lichenis]|uniref:Type VI secretion system tip protein TssI/VgrG n=1 Tax=Paracraurococcus lichenis TaxID=3064888 RepID=A0ABT9DXW8_9PROT|nr:type VI secretion system tip protein TssI/VgrG [Paracraurococcus sp. LOR1-02]MDO9708758.1 type VI secretion system tip protein TssI/VgrG [Paracraurococcus sp. LOR1-02]